MHFYNFRVDMSHNAGGTIVQSGGDLTAACWVHPNELANKKCHQAWRNIT